MYTDYRVCTNAKNEKGHLTGVRWKYNLWEQDHSCSNVAIEMSMLSIRTVPRNRIEGEERIFFHQGLLRRGRDLKGTGYAV